MRLYDNDAYREDFMALVYELLHRDGTNDRANQIIYDFDMAPEVEAEPFPPNDPLTLEELREMCGEPVWIERHDGGQSRWAIVGDCDSLYGVYFGTAQGGMRLHYEECGKSWIPHRNKVEDTK